MDLHTVSYYMLFTIYFLLLTGNGGCISYVSFLCTGKKKIKDLQGCSEKKKWFFNTNYGIIKRKIIHLIYSIERR